jgi:hypothetical protein
MVSQSRSAPYKGATIEDLRRRKTNFLILLFYVFLHSRESWHVRGGVL